MIGRRGLLAFAGGSAAGLALSPVPWKLLDDVSIWTQNWWLTPPAPRGDVETKFTTCTACPAGCGVRARCVGGQPFALAGVPGDPAGSGRLCPLGLTAHQAPFHPKRVKRAFRRVRQGDGTASLPAPAADIAKEVAGALRSAQSAVILDGRPGRTASLLYRRAAAALPNCIYAKPPIAAGATLRALAALIGAPANSLAFDMANARTVLSFGTPVLDRAVLPGKRVIQAEPTLSPTASLAQDWLPVRPGTEGALALAIAHELLREKPQGDASFRELARAFPPERAASLTGLPIEKIRAAARAFASGEPSIAIADGAPGAAFASHELAAVAVLNVLAGNVMTRPATPLPSGFETGLAAETDLEAVPDRSVDVLIAVEPSAIPAALIARKLKGPQAKVVAVSATLGGISRRADFVVPAPAGMEILSDAAEGAEIPAAAFAIAPPLMKAPEGVAEPAVFLASVLREMGESEPPAPADVLMARADAIYKARRGKLFRYATGESPAVADIASAEDFWTALNEGGCWTDDQAAALKPSRIAFETLAAARPKFEQTVETGPEYPVAAVAAACCAAPGDALLSPALTKLYQESELKQACHVAAVNPETGRAGGLEDGVCATVRSRSGACAVRVAFDAGVMPGVLRVSNGPSFEYVAGWSEPQGGTVMDMLGAGAARTVPVRISRA